MGIKTDIIRFNLTERNRKHTGKDRMFNIPAVVRLINSPKIQERVKKGDIFGYLGHDVRRQFGMVVPTVGIVDNKIIPIEPALRTIHLKAYDDGTIEHQAEFLDTPLGKTAQSWHQQGIGGFSSVILPNEYKPDDFQGFDYVFHPNFHANRGYQAVLDDASMGHELNRLTSKQKFEVMKGLNLEKQAVLDAVMESAQEFCTENFDLKKTNEQLTATVESLFQQNQDLEDQYLNAQHELDQVQAPAIKSVRLNAADNWLIDSMRNGVLDDIGQFDVDFTDLSDDQKQKTQNLISDHQIEHIAQSIVGVL